MANIGVITEQNDLGLGFDPLSQKDQRAYKEADQSATSSSEQNSQQKND